MTLDRLLCQLCKFQAHDGKDLSRHLSSAHQTSFMEYAIKLNYNNVRPKCLECDEFTRFVHKDLSFKTYCKKHSCIAESLGGRKGGSRACTFKGETKHTRAHLKKASEKMTGKGNPQYGKPHDVMTKNKISATKRLDGKTLEERVSVRSSEFILLTSLEEYESRQKQYLTFKCKHCDSIQKKTLQAFERGSKCEFCFPIGRSAEEHDMFSFISSIAPDAISNDRTVIGPKEIDVFVPSRNYGFEYCGLYHHSDAAPVPKPKDYHLFKMMNCEKNGVRLVQFFSDEWKFKRDICESMIRHRLGLARRKLAARKCDVKTVSWKEASNFFERTHISGAVPAKEYFALYFGSEIVAMMSLRNPIQKKTYPDCIEVARFSTALNTHVNGGLQKLLKYASDWATNSGYKRIITYVDRRVGNGAGYERVGFKRTGDTGISYEYTDCTLRYDRFLYRPKEGRSEEEISREAKVNRIYGCGSWIYQIDL